MCITLVLMCAFKSTILTYDSLHLRCRTRNIGTSQYALVHPRDVVNDGIRS